MGKVILPTSSLSGELDHCVKEVYWPLIAANACAPASIARQSFPVAITTGSIPFIIPLLWVAALYGSTTAKDAASKILLMTSWPSYSAVSNWLGPIFTEAVTSRLSAKFDKILNLACP